MNEKQYVVVGAYVSHVPVTTESGARLIDLNQGAVLPAGVPQDRIDHLLDVGLIAEVDAAPAAAKPQRPASGPAKS